MNTTKTALIILIITAIIALSIAKNAVDIIIAKNALTIMLD
jgi:hypothetical protein